jgi:hypothetical protein
MLAVSLEFLIGRVNNESRVEVKRMRRVWSSLFVIVMLGPLGFGPVAAASGPSAAPEVTVDLGAAKAYLLDKASTMKQHTADLSDTSSRYYDLAKAANFDYAKLWKDRKAVVVALIHQARQSWIAASPLYEQMEGVVAGVPSLRKFDVILDSGASAVDGGSNVVPFDLTLPDGRILKKPGNLFGVTESTLWGTFAEYRVRSVRADFNGNGRIEFGEVLPDANVLKAGTAALDAYSGELLTAARAWSPTVSDNFTALVVMVPTMNEYFESWKHSRFVAGNASTQRDFVVVSRLADIQDIIAGLEVVYAGVAPLVRTVDQAQAEQIGQRLRSMRMFVAGIHARERAGKRFTPEEADTLGAETQAQATAVTGMISQAAVRLRVTIQQ